MTKFKSTGHTHEEWNAPELSWSKAKVVKKIRELKGLQLNGDSDDVIIGHGLGTEEFGFMKGSFGIFTFYRKSHGVEYYHFANPPC